MKKITKKESEEILKFSKMYINIHSQMTEIETQINELENKASVLVSLLDDCRKKESELMERMTEKYGQGKLNPFTLIWENKKEQYEKISN